MYLFLIFFVVEICLTTEYNTCQKTYSVAMEMHLRFCKFRNPMLYVNTLMPAIYDSYPVVIHARLIEQRLGMDKSWNVIGRYNGKHRVFDVTTLGIY